MKTRPGSRSIDLQRLAAPYTSYGLDTLTDRDKLSVASALEAELGGRAPDALAALPEPERRAFADTLRDAKARQSRELETAIDQSLGVVPRLLRGTIRKILFG